MAAIIRLAWGAADNGTMYHVERKTQTTSYSEIGQTDSLSMDDTTWQQNQTYTYRVNAGNKWGKGPYTNEVTTDTTAPSAPGTLTLEIV